MRQNIGVIKVQVDRMLEIVLAMSKENLQHVVANNVCPPSGFTIVTNSMYGVSPEYPLSQLEASTQPLPVHILISNEVSIMPENSYSY